MDAVLENRHLAAFLRKVADRLRQRRRQLVGDFTVAGLEKFDHLDRLVVLRRSFLADAVEARQALLQIGHARHIFVAHP